MHTEPKPSFFERMAHARRARKTRNSARGALREMASEVMSRPFRVEQKRMPGVLNKVRTFHFERDTPTQRKQAEQLLKVAFPILNRKERRQLARRHGYIGLVAHDLNA